MKIGELVKTYRIINDPEAPPWSVKFVGAIFLVAALAVGFGAIFYASHETPSPSGNALMSTSQANNDGTRTDYVGYAPGSFDAAAGFAQGSPDALLAAWKVQHPAATILAQQPVGAGGATIGYDVTYRP